MTTNESNYKEKIIKTLRSTPYPMRKRYIAHYIGCWQYDTKFLIAMNELKDSGVIVCSTYKGPAQMEFYDEYDLKERATI